MKYQFGENEELLSFTDSGGNVYSYAYEGGRLTQLQNPDGSASMLEYDAAGRVATVVNPDKSTINYEYDSNDNMVSLLQ